MFRCEFIGYAAGLALMAGAQAQTCERYWSALPVSELPGYPQVSLVPLDSAEGPRLYAHSYQTGNDRLFYWHGSAWVEVTRKGLPPPVGIGRIHALNDGTGIHLYAQWYPGNITQSPPYRGYRLDGDRWTPMPEDFWGGQFWGPWVSADLGSGIQMFGLRFPKPSVWDGEAWRSLGLSDQSGGWVHLEAGNDGTGTAVYIFGGLWQLNGQTAYGFAKWDGQSMSLPFTEPLAAISGYGSYPDRCAVTFDDGTGPAMYSIRGPMYGHSNTHQPVLWRYRYNQWSVVGLPDATSSLSGQGSHICLFDDGRGPAIYVMGLFDNVNGVPCNQIARWDGHTWEALGVGFTNGSNANLSNTRMGVVNDDSGSALVVVGDGINWVGGGSARRGAKWVGCPNCYANCDLSTAFPKLTANDFMCFINKFAAKDPYANCDGGTSINAADFACFLNRYAAGCS